MITGSHGVLNFLLLRIFHYKDVTPPLWLSISIHSEHDSTRCHEKKVSGHSNQAPKLPIWHWYQPSCFVLDKRPLFHSYFSIIQEIEAHIQYTQKGTAAKGTFWSTFAMLPNKLYVFFPNDASLWLKQNTKTDSLSWK